MLGIINVGYITVAYFCVKFDQKKEGERWETGHLSHCHSVYKDPQTWMHGEHGNMSSESHHI